jgi:Zn-dependent membrane protease YugP
MYEDYYIYYGLTMLAMLVTFGAQFYISTVYSRYSKIRNRNGFTGARTANEILFRNGLGDVEVTEVNGYLSDHFDPLSKKVSLSQTNYSSDSIASMAIAAHECGHALQHQADYAFLKIRASLLPVANISSYAGYMAIMLGLFLGQTNLIWLGIALEGVILLFQLVTLPVEFDASSRALAQIRECGIGDEEELKGAKTVLTAAALTYVAGVASTLLQMLRLILVYGRRRDNR